MSRSQNSAKNIFFGYIGNIVITILGFVLRTVFIYKLGKTLLGVNGLYTNILSVLSLADLGLGTAMNFSLYDPVAKKDYKRITIYMSLFKKAYRYIAAVVAVLGLLLVPFLQYIIKDPGDIGIGELRLYYVIFLVNIVSTYFVAYKYSLVNAEQKGYIQTNILTITKFITVSLQIVVLLSGFGFTVYLLTQMSVELVQKLFVSIYLDRKYPYLLDKPEGELPEKDKREIVKNVKALLLHKIGDIARFQTDNIIISAFISISLVGMVDNYVLVTTSVSGFVNILFNSVIASLGNLIATENKEKQYQVFKAYRFMGAWIYGFSAVGYFVLLTPLISLLWGNDYALGIGAVGFFLLDYYFKGFRIVLTNFKTAAGIFDEDKYIALIQGVINLVISIVLVQKLGLIGVYIGTVVSGLIANVVKPSIIYKKCFDRKVSEYYRDSLVYILISAVSIAIVLGFNTLIATDNWLGFAIMAILITVVFNGLFIILFHRTDEFRYLLDKVKQMAHRNK